MLKRKALRVIQYPGNNRIKTVKEEAGSKGYAAGFNELIVTVNSMLPSSEVIEHGRRKRMPAYPELALREIVANALMHQDFFMSGVGRCCFAADP